MRRAVENRIFARAIAAVLVAALAMPAAARAARPERPREAAELRAALSGMARVAGREAGLGGADAGALGKAASPASLPAVLAAYDALVAADLLAAERFASVRRRLEEAGGSAEAFARLAAAEARYAAARSRFLAPLDGPMAELRGALAGKRAVPGAVEDRVRAALAAVGPFLEESVEEERPPILRASQLPYRPTGLAARPPVTSPPIVPAYLDATDPAEGGADLAPTADAPFADEILAQAAALDHDYVRLYELVRNEVATEWYGGGMKGAVETLRQKAGNDVDQASLLLALFRASGLAARYVHGVIELPIEAAAASLGVADPNSVPAALARAGVAHRPVVRGGRLAAVEVEHTWVEARAPYANYRGAVVDFSGKSWVPLLPAVKTVDVALPTGVLRQMGFSAAGAVTSYLAAPQTLDPLGVVRQQVETYLAGQPGQPSYAAQLGSRAVRPERVGLLPSSPPAVVVAITGEGAVLPEALRHRVRIVARTGEAETDAASLDLELPLAEVVGHRLTLSYIPATVDDHRTVNLFGGLEGVPVYLVSLRPVLRLDGRPLAVGAEPIAMGERHRLEVHLAGPYGGERVEQTAVAGGYYAVGLGAQRFLPRADEGGAAGDEESLGARILSSLALGYGESWDEGERELAGLFAVGLVRPLPAVVIAANAVAIESAAGLPLNFVWEGVTLDAALRVAEPFAPPADAGAAASFLRLSALQGSALEHSVFEQELLVQSISADKGLGLARQLGQQVVSIDAGNVAALLPTLDHPAAVEAEIENWARLGLVVEVPVARVALNAWQGSVWRVDDPASGAGGYFLSGGLAGGATTEEPDNWVLDFLADALAAPYSPEPNQDPLAAARMIKLGATDGQQGEVDELLPTALAVQVLDAENRPVEGAEVRFSSYSGGGKLSGEGGGEGPEATVLTDRRGIAEARLRLGTSTAADPVFVRRHEADRYLTQALIHQVEATATGRGGLVTLPQPFTAVGVPGPPEALRRTDRSGDEFQGDAGSWVDTLHIAAEDRFGNPVANVPVDFNVGPPLPQIETCVNLAAGFENAVVFENHTDAVPPGACNDPYPQLGDCGVPSLTALTRTREVAVGVIMGSSTVSAYHVLVSNVEIGGEPLRFGYGVLFVEQIPGHFCGAWIGFKLFGPRVDAGGNAVRAGHEFPRPIRLEPVHLEEDIELRTRPNGDVYTEELDTATWTPLHVRGLNVSVTNGGSAAAPEPLGNDAYQVRLTAGATPGLNEVTAHLPESHYWAGFYNEPDEVDPFDGIDYGHIPHCFPAPCALNFAVPPLWGVEPSITGVTPEVLSLTEQGFLTQEVALAYRILPAEYTAGSAELLIYADDEWIGVAQGSSRTGEGQATIQRGFEFDLEKVYEAELVLNRGGSSEVRSDRFRIPLFQGLFRDVEPPTLVSQEVDVLNQRSCALGSVFKFGLTQEADVTLVFRRVDALTTEGEPILGDPITVLDDERLAQGDYSYMVTPSGFAPAVVELPPGDYLWELSGVSAVDGHEDELHGPVESSYRARNSLPIGHLVVKGVDLWDGHLTLQRDDFKVPGRGIPLSFSRSYSSNGDSEPGPLGIGWTHGWDQRVEVTPCGEVIVVGGDGSGMRFVDDGQGGLKPLKGSHGTLRANPADLSFDFYTTAGVRYHYGLQANGKWPLALIEDPNGNTTTLRYETGVRGPRLAAVTDAAGRELRLRHSLLNFALTPPTEVITGVEGPGGIALVLSYDGFGHLARVEREPHPAQAGGEPRPSRIETYRYALPPEHGLLDRDLLLEIKDEVTGAARQYAYERSAVGLQGDILVPTSHVTELIEPLGGKTTFELDVTNLADPDGEPELTTRVEDRRGKTTTYTLNRYGSPLAIEDPLGHRTETTWAPDDIVMTSRKDPNGVTTTFTYDGDGNLLTESVEVTDFEGHTETLLEMQEYAPAGQFSRPGIKNRVARRTDRKGAVTELEYDARGNLTRQSTAITGGSAVEVRHTYLSNGDLATTRDPRGSVTTFTYDAYGNVASHRDPLNSVASTEWDARSRAVRRTDELGRATTMAYDVLDRLVEVRPPQAAGDTGPPVLATEHDDAARTMVTVDLGGRRTETRFDLEGRMVEVRNAAGGTRAYGYDAEGNKTLESTWFDAATPRFDTTFVYDDAGRLTERHEPLGRTTTYERDGLGNPTREVLSDSTAPAFAPRETITQYDELSRALRVRRPFEDGTVEVATQYDGEGNAVLLVDPLGRRTELTYDALNRLVTQVEPEWKPGSPRTTTYRYDPAGNLVEERLANQPADRVRVSEYDALNRLVRQVDGTGGVTVYEYDAVGNNTRQVDPLLNQTTFAYDARNRLTTRSEHLTRVTAPPRVVTTGFGYDAVDNLVEERWPNGNTVEHRYDLLGRRIETRDDLGVLATYGYDARGNRVRSADANGNVTETDYDALDRVREQRLPEDRIRSFAWDAAGNPASSTDARGHTRTYRHDRLNRLLESKEPAPFGYTVSYTYDRAGNQLSEADRRGNARTFDYDALNRLAAEHDPEPLSYSVAYTYDALGNQTSETDRRGIVTEHRYDAEGRRVETRRSGVTLSTASYDAAGNQRFATDANGHTTGYEYDERNLLLAENRPLAAITGFVLDDLGDRVRETDPEGRASTFAYDARRRLISSANGAGDTTLYGYDGQGNRTSMEQPEGGEWLYRFDAADRLREVEDPLGRVTAYSYDGNGNRTAVTDANLHTRGFGYDELDRLQAMVYPGGALETYGYDANGNRTTVTDPKGQVATSTFDEVNRETLRQYSAAVPSTGDDLESIATVYDPNNNPTSVTEVYTGPSGTRTTTKTYDSFDRLVSVTDPRGETISYAYDTNGNRTRLTDPDGRLTLYAFDELNRMTSATVQVAGITEYSYFKDSRLKRVIYPNGSRSSYAYDPAGRLATLDNSQGTTAVISSFAYTYDKNGNRLEQRETNGGALEVTTYAYDLADRLAGVVYPDKEVEYLYDAAGNRVHERVEAAGTLLADKTYVYDARDRLLSVADAIAPAATVTYGYDANGNQVSRTQAGVATEFVVDARDQIAEVRRGGTLLETYRYDYQGLRIRKAGEAGPVRYVYDDQSVLLQTDDAGNTVAKYEYGPDRLLSLLHAAEGRQFYLFDALGSVVNLVKPDGALAARYQWDAWGNLRATAGSSFNPFGFTGYEKDPATGLFYAKARFYDPETALFLSEDPVAGNATRPPSLHKYLYAFQNPTVYVDPSGRHPELKKYEQELDAFADSMETLIQILSQTPLAQTEEGKKLIASLAKDAGMWAGVARFGEARVRDLNYAINFLWFMSILSGSVKPEELPPGMAEELKGDFEATVRFGQNMAAALRYIKEHPIEVGAQAIDAAKKFGLDALKFLVRLASDDPEAVFKAYEKGTEGVLNLMTAYFSAEFSGAGQVMSGLKSTVGRWTDDAMGFFRGKRPNVDLPDASARRAAEHQAGTSAAHAAERKAVEAAPAAGVPTFRVQGGVLPNASKIRFVVDAEGKLAIVGTDRLHITVGQEKRAMEFLAKRGETAVLVRFELRPEFVERMRAESVRQAAGKAHPNLPQRVDEHLAPDQFGVPEGWFDELLENVVPGSVRIEAAKP